MVNWYVAFIFFYLNIYFVLLFNKSKFLINLKFFVKVSYITLFDSIHKINKKVNNFKRFAAFILLHYKNVCLSFQVTFM